MIAAILGVLKAGKAYVPLDPAYPAERLAYILADSQASAVLTNDENMVLTKTSTNGTRQINIDAIDHAGSIENLIVPISPDALVYILYTSGSTGRPKGVMQNHRNVLHHIRNYTNNLHLNPADRLILLSTYSFDAAIMDIFGALLNGATLYPIDVKQETPEAIAAWLSDQEITVYHSTPAIYRYFLTFLTSKKDLSAIRLVVLGGEEVQKKDVDLFKRYFSPQSILVNGLGPTESTLALQYFINHETQITGNTVPVGYPVDGTAVLLLNEAGADAEIHGEIAIRSEHVALGYWEKPEMTRAAFLADPEGGTKRIYRTGDMGRLLHDGSIAFSGRKDSQVKIRGYRIELGEIEAVLGQHPAVQETVVVSREDVDGDKRLIAYIVPTQEQDLTVSALRSFLKSKLPECMVPSTFMFLDALPLTSHGKVDHQGLPDPQSDATKTGYEFVEPRDETERVLCRIWAETLKLDRVGIDDDFFAVGGHSLLAAKLFSRLDEQFGRSLPLGVLFSAPTVRALAEHYRSEPQKQFRAMVALRKTGTLPPVFAVPGVFGNVVGFAELCRELGPEQPFYGLQSVGLDGSEVPLTSIEEMAKLNISELFTVQPRGPYAIIGACFGATVAYEMARQLLADGHEVLFLGLLDPSAREGREANEDLGASPRILRRAAALGSLVTNRLLLYLDELNRLNGKNRLKFIAGKLSSLSESLKHVHGFKGVQRELNQIEVFRANLNAFDHYQRKRLIGRLRTMEIFETARRVNDSWCDIVDWGNFSENAIHRHMVPGKDSGQMLTGENCRVVALLLAERLRTAITRD
jgi:amino acid adenylation domain-containing protein